MTSFILGKNYRNNMPVKAVARACEVGSDDRIAQL